MKKGNIVLAIICAVLGIGIIAISSTYPTAADYKTGVPGPGLWPTAISVVLLACCALLVWRTLKMPREKDTKIDMTSGGPRRVYITMAILVAYVALLEPLGFIIATTTLEFIFIQWFVKKNPLFSLAVSLAITMAVFCTFQYVLNVPVGSFGLIQLN